MTRLPFFLLLILLALPAQAQVIFDHLTTADGLSQSTVWKLVQDKKGFIWMATADGLNRYDGYSFKVFRNQPDQPHSLPTNDIATIHVDRHNTLWVAPRKGGLHRLRADGETFEHYPKTAQDEPVGQVSITCFAEDPENLWLGTSENGLLRYHYRSGTVQKWKDARLGNSITALYHEDNRLWVGTNDGRLIALSPDTKSRTVYSIPFGAEVAARHRGITVIQRDRQGRLWVGTTGRGLFQFEPTSTAFHPVFFRPGVYETINVILDVVEDKPGNLWVLTDYGAVLYPAGNLQQLAVLLPDAENDKSLSTHALKKALCDAQGNLWIGTWQGGVNIHRAQREKFTSIRHQPHNAQSLLTTKVTAVVSDRLGGLWVGSNKGLTAISPDRKRYRHFHQNNSPLGSDDINSLSATPAGNVLIGTWTAGFAFYDVKTARFTPFNNLGRSKSVKVIAAGQSGRTWIGTNERELFRFNETTKQLESIDLSPISRVYKQFDINFNAPCEDSFGNLWIGTYNTGLLRWNRRTGRVQHFVSDGKAGSLGSNSIISIFEDGQKRLWIGTNGGGLNRFDERTERFISLTTKQGLSSNFIAGILQDADGTLWLSTNGGISSFNPATGAIQNYDQSDGLVGREFLPGACAQLPSGELAFGSMQGLVLFHPARLKEKPAPPPVYLTDLKLFNRPMNPADANAPTKLSLPDAEFLRFQPSQSVFTLEYAGISYLYNRNIRYAYKLEGFDTDWNYVGTQRSATYTNQHEGNYTFLVKAAIGNSDWSQPRAVRIEVLPPWYRTRWTYALYGLTFLGLLYALRRIILIRERLKADIRIKQIETETIKALDDAKTSFFTNVSHEFRTPLTLILAPLESLTEERSFDAKLQHQFQTIQRNAQRLLRLVNQLLDLSKLESGSLIPSISRHDVVQFIERISQSFGELADNKRIALHFKANFDSFEGFFDADILEKIVYNLLSNALRFTPAGGEVRLSVLISPVGPAPVLILRVADTGIGISEENLGHIFERFYQAEPRLAGPRSAGGQSAKKTGSGIGLALTRELVELHRGEIGVDSTEKVGTQFTVSLPLHATAFPPKWLSHEPEALVEWSQPLLPAVVPEGPATPSGKALPILLLVEDNEELRQYLNEYFSRNYHVLTAPDGKTAIAQAQKHIPDLVISDWLMPEMDGTELCQALKRDEKTSHIPFLLLTSRSSNQSQLHAFETGIDDYMTKPFNLAILETKAKSLIQNRQILREKWSKKGLGQPSAVLPGGVPSGGLPLPPLEEQFIQKAIKIIETHLDDSHFDAEQLEDALNLSRMQFYRKLKSITNLSGTEFIRQVRLRRAMQLLESGQYNVSEVAYRVGFNDPAYFSRCFKKEFGKAPLEYLSK